jgi:alkaline phosphatase D
MNFFQHGVASGDPLQDRVILWTRVTTAEPNEVQLEWELAEDSSFQRVVCSGVTFAKIEDDHSVHVDAEGLNPGCRYFYRFHARGETSVTGRTKTLPAAGVAHLRFAQTSCSKFNAGFFNVYARIAERDDLDFLLHLGDYIYETANIPPSGQTAGAEIGRPFEPLHECKTLADYRMRYSQYRRDPDAQAMHAALPIIATVDDHEFADGAWRGGADVHEEDKDGPWAERLKVCFRVRWEWLPIRHPDPADTQRVYRSVQFGGLADLFLINTRTYRDQPVPAPEMNAPERTELGPEQREWLFREFEESKSRWQILGNPSVLSTTWRENISEEIKLPLLKTKLIAADGNGPDYDQWDGYPAERKQLLNLFRKHRGGTVVLSGDIHVGMVCELEENPFDEKRDVVAVEFINSSVTSQNLDDKMKWGYRTDSLKYEQAILREFPHVKWCDFDSHGFNIVDVTQERVQVEYWGVDVVTRRSNGVSLNSTWVVEHGTPKLLRIE